MICTVNQLPGFHMRATLALNGLILQNLATIPKLSKDELTPSKTGNGIYLRMSFFY